MFRVCTELSLIQSARANIAFGKDDGETHDELVAGGMPIEQASQLVRTLVMQRREIFMATGILDLLIGAGLSIGMFAAMCGLIGVLFQAVDLPRGVGGLFVVVCVVVGVRGVFLFGRGLERFIDGDRANEITPDAPWGFVWLRHVIRCTPGLVVVPDHEVKEKATFHGKQPAATA